MTNNEIEQLEMDLEVTRYNLGERMKELASAEEEIERLKAEIERLTERLEKRTTELDRLTIYFDKAVEKKLFEFVEMLKWKATATHKTVAGHYRYEITNDFIDNLAKEMVGDTYG